MGQIYNIASKDEISNTEICYKLLKIFGLPCETKEDLEMSIQHTQDRPFNDMRYATDGSKLSTMGWQPKTSFDDGLKKTVDWYRRFGEVWWGDISRVLTPFPVVEGTEIWTKEEHDALPLDEQADSSEQRTAGKSVWTAKAWTHLQQTMGAKGVNGE